VLNVSADYALRAVLCVAQPKGGRAWTTSSIAKATGIPRNYLGKVLHALVGAGVLASVRGPHGGFRLAVPATEMTLADVAAPFQKLPERSLCLLGNRPCDRTRPCIAHRRWQEASDQVTSFFRGTTIAAMLAGDASTDPSHNGAPHDKAAG